jgi:gamma-glutamyl:cysteine ligase YbdK (ATP-grasp superfamily)
MGLAINHETFSDAEYARFDARLRADLDALAIVLERPGFGVGETTLGAELELCIVDEASHALGVNRDILRDHVDERLTMELDRFNLEYNLTPVSARGAPFSAMQSELARALRSLAETARPLGGRIAAIGILPTITPADVEATALTDFPRYRALNNGLRRLKKSAFNIRIDGEDPLVMRGDDITLEGANTSFQVHLRVDPARYVDTYNAAQLMTPIALALAGNSPIFCGHRLWEETRVALFKQSLDVRDLVETNWREPARVSFGHGWARRSAFELFAESAALFPCILPICGDEDPIAKARAGEMPQLDELRLQQGTVWRWNRAIYDPDDGGHLRIEMRAFPAGPTSIDMVANAAFLIGLTIGIRDRIESFLPRLPFTYAEWNFYRAAQLGLDAKLLWPSETAPSPTLIPVRALIEHFIPDAEYGLAMLGVEMAEVQRMMDVIRGRLTTGMTGAQWQRRAFSRGMQHLDRESALARMMSGYIDRSASGCPVHEWDVP